MHRLKHFNTSRIKLFYKDQNVLLALFPGLGCSSLAVQNLPIPRPCVFVACSTKLANFVLQATSETLATAAIYHDIPIFLKQSLVIHLDNVELLHHGNCYICISCVGLCTVGPSIFCPCTKHKKITHGPVYDALYTSCTIFVDGPCTLAPNLLLLCIHS